MDVSTPSSSNEMHQLLVSVSRYQYVQKNGTVAWQWKAIDIDLSRRHQAKRDHLVFFVVRDVVSGACYGEIGCLSRMLSLPALLQRAWARKLDGTELLQGLPRGLVIPDRVFEAFPIAAVIINRLQIDCFRPTSGFAAGVRDIREWENTVRCRPWERTPDVVLSKGPEVAAWINRRLAPPRINVWRTLLRDELRFAPPDFDFEHPSKYPRHGIGQ